MTNQARVAKQSSAQRPSPTAPDSAPGYADSKAAHLKRLARIEGQVRGIARMVEQDQYCIDVLTQVSAATKALQAVALQLLDEHLAHCLVSAVEAGGAEKDAKLAEASAAVARLVRS
jgi:DNA-binding FrmR family transcriptional regulator